MTSKSIALVAAATTMTLFIVAVIILADTRNLGFMHVVYEYRHGDKLGHLMLYGLLSFLLNSAAIHLLPQHPPRRVAWITSLGLASSIAAEELSQVWLPSRAPDWYDLAAGLIGVAFFAVLAVRLTNPDRQRAEAPST